MEWCCGLSEGDRPPKVLEAGSSGPQPISPGYRVQQERRTQAGVTVREGAPQSFTVQARPELG